MRDIDAYADFYVERSFEEYQVEFRRKKVLEVIRQLNSKKILEIGCGMEPIFKYLNTDSYESFTVVEPSEMFCKNAREIAGTNEKVKIINGFFEEAASDLKEKFDLILCSGLLLELEEPERVLEAIKSVCDSSKELSPVVHINVPNANSIHRILAKEMGLIDDVHTMTERNIKLQQHRVYDIEMLKKQVEEQGFSVIEEGSYFVKFLPHSMMMKMMDQNIISYQVLEGMYQLEKYLPGYGSEIYVNVVAKEE